MMCKLKMWMDKVVEHYDVEMKGWLQKAAL